MGGMSRAAFNPAVAVGITTIGLVGWSNIWLYLVADLLGDLVAGVMLKVLNPEDK